MASRNFNEFRLSLEKRVVNLYGKITFGATGAPTLDTANSKGIASVTRTSAGLFVLTLSDRYVKLLDFGWAFKLAAASFPAAPNCQVTADTLTTTRTITVQFANPAGTTATDPASGEVVYFNVTLGDSTAS